PYMSPEQLRGREVDQRTDVFSLGVLLYEMAAGARPFGGPTNADLTSQILTRAPDDLTSVRPELPAQLGRIVARCLEKDPADRYASGREVREELRALQREVAGGTVTAAAPGAATRAGGGGRSRGGTVAWGAAAVLAIVIAAAALLRSGDESSDASGGGGRTIAVLPFENLSPDEADAFFTTGVHDDLMATLGGLGDLRVISRTSVRSVEPGSETVRQIGRRLGARYVVEGSVRRADHQVRVTAQLIDAETDRSLWSGSYDHELADVLALQSRIAREIALTLEAQLSAEEESRLGNPRTVVVAAYDEYLRARNLLNASRLPFDGLEEAIGRLEEATRIDPQFAEGWALLCTARCDLHERLKELDGRRDDARTAGVAAESALARARKIAPESAATYRAAGYFQDSVEDDPVAALRSMDRALELNPSDAEALSYQALNYFGLGQVDRAVEAAERAYALDAANGRNLFGLTFLYELTGRYADMVPIFERLAALEPERTHLGVQAKYYAFLADGSLAAFRELEEAVRTVKRTEQCDVRSVQDREMVVAMVNDEFDEYFAAWQGKWDRHYAGHGDWACPAFINDEANQASLLARFGHPEQAHEIVERAKEATTRPYTEMSMCIFDRAAFEPKLQYLSGDSVAARRSFEESVPAILRNDAFPRGAIERRVLLQTADLVAPDRVYSLYRDIIARPNSMIRLEEVCANPWTYPNLLKDPGFLKEVRADGRFVEFLEHYEVIRKADA
ncbi:MAG TPA: protein kinase, partial [bacterium]|nr:protein kinase [bacterium]